MDRQNVRQKVTFYPPGPGLPLLPPLGPGVCTPTLFTLSRLCVCFYLSIMIAFPEDDRLEYDLHAEEKRHDQIQASLNSESRAAESLARAVRFMDACQSSMQEALGYSRYGPFQFVFVFLPPYTIY